jgi:hypothetical protein
VSYKHRKEVAADLKLIYGAATEAEAQVYLELFAEKWDRLYSTISKLWRTHWSRVIPLFAFPEDIRKVIYTTNAIESVNMTLRKVTRNYRIFPSDEAVYKVVAPFHEKYCQEVDDADPPLETCTQSFGCGFRGTLSGCIIKRICSGKRGDEARQSIQSGWVMTSFRAMVKSTRWTAMFG